MAHRGIFLLAFVIGLAACGGKVGTGDPPTPPTPTVKGWRSYTLTFTEVKRTSPSGPYGTVSGPSEGKSMRFDFYSGPPTGSVPQAVAGPVFGEPIALQSTDGATNLHAAGESRISFTAPAPMGSVVDQWTAFTLELDTEGRAIGGTASGKTDVFSGDMAWMTDTTGRFTLVPDVDAPSWRASTSLSIASRALPWDERTFETSEPFEQPLSGPRPAIHELLGVSSEAVSAIDILPAFQWSDTGKSRGIRFRLENWDLADSLAGRVYGVRDLNGNLTAPASAPLAFEGVAVPRIGSRELDFTSGALGMTALWGDAKEASCPDGTSCLRIGPFTQTLYGCQGSAGGLAVRFPGSGLVRASIRAIAKPNTGGPVPSYAPPPPSFAHLQAATPGVAPTMVESTTLRWSDKPGSDGNYDTGWGTLEIMPTGAGAETGVALGGGGIASSGCGSFGGAPPYSPLFQITIYVDRISLVASK